MQPTDMHSLLLQPQPQLLQPLQPLTATGMYSQSKQTLSTVLPAASLSLFLISRIALSP